MNTLQIETTLAHLYKDAKCDRLKMMKRLAIQAIKPLRPKDFKDVYLSISKKEGDYLKQLIQQNKLKNIVEFGTSFGISTLFLAQGVLLTGGRIITTELLASKAQKAIANFKEAGVNERIEVRIGDAMKTLKNHKEPIDLLVLDGWKDLYLPLFQMLESNFHNNTYIYVDNAEMAETQVFLKTIDHFQKYQLQSKFGGKVVLITIKQLPHS
ncbi:class I SAM-dependent methyltransferase [Cellulophaga sp. F20128]|uniref:O-methyltransferase n=1 Tax=Cellulophaga sp. F20128 TaxID=2926413 RepID=UPI001FF1C66F|nr:class I SAM-dependent methyltransferase [Cellulophaga sp. F20128]MCK0155795.1 class I SAM-dependent methyltransferase [Cellulophaga sp. F20128]